MKWRTTVRKTRTDNIYKEQGVTMRKAERIYEEAWGLYMSGRNGAFFNTLYTALQRDVGIELVYLTFV